MAMSKYLKYPKYILQCKNDNYAVRLNIEYITYQNISAFLDVSRVSMDGWPL